MKLEAVLDDRSYCSSGRTLLREADDGTFTRVGRLPVPGEGFGRLRLAAVTTRPARAPVDAAVGRYLTTNVWPFEDGTVVASLGRWVLASDDGGASWTVGHRLPASSGLRGVLPEAVCRHDGALYLGEYPLATDATPRVLRSTDGGATWSTVLALPGVRHVHAVQSDPFGDAVWVTTGDRDEECRIGRLVDGELRVVGAGSQRWRAAELAFTPSAVLWGMDCRYVDENELLRLDRTALDDPEPEPVAVGTAPTSVYHAATLSVGDDRWVAFSTGGETDPDSTGPGGADDRREEVTMDVLAAAASSGYADWHHLGAYRKRRCVADYASFGGRLPTANAYVFLAGDPDRGLVINPYNAVPDDGRLRRVPPDRLAALAGTDPPAGETPARPPSR